MIEETGLGLFSDLVGAPAESDRDLEDEVLATDARARYRAGDMIEIEPDEEMRSLLASDEQLIAIRETADVERLIDGVRSPASGLLAITDKRLLLVDGQATALASIDELEDATLVTDRLLVTMSNGVGLMIDAAHPRLLRVELAEARARWSEAQHATPPSGGAGPESGQPRR